MNESSDDVKKTGLSPATETRTRAFTFDEAFDEAKFGKFNYFVIFVSGIIITYALVEATAIGYILPVSQCDLNLTESQKGILGAVAFAGAIVSAQLWGFLADTLGRRKVLMPALFLSFLSSTISSLAGQFWLLAVFRFCAGFFGTGVSAVIYAYLGELHGSNLRSRAIMAASFVFGIAFVLVPFEAWLVINQDWSIDIPYLAITFKPWRLFFVVCGLPGLISSLCFLKLPESPKFLLSQGRESEAIEVLKRIYSINTGRRGDNLNVDSLIEEKEDSPLKSTFDKDHPIKSTLKSLYHQTAPLFQGEYLKKTVLACTIQFGIFATCNGVYVWFVGLLNQMVKFMNTNPGNSTTLCEVVYSNIQATQMVESSNKCIEQLEFTTYTYSLALDSLYAIGFSVMGFIINTVGPIPIMFVIFVFSGLCGIAITFVNIPWLSISLYVSLLTCGLNIPVVSAATVDIYPTYVRSMAVCITLMLGRVGSLVGSNIVGVLIENHCETAFLIAGLSLVLCGLLAFFIPKPREETLNETELTVNPVAGNYAKSDVES